MSSLNIIFAGTPEFGLPCLTALNQSPHHLAAVYTQPDRPAGRGRKLQASAVKEWALAHNIPVYQPLNFKTQDAVDELAALKPDLMVVIAYGLILPRKVLDIPRLGCINVHASLLPRWRGASPIQQVILHGEKQTGVTIMQMDVGLDTGPMLAKSSCVINATDTAGSLHDKLAALSAKPLLDTVNLLAHGQVQAEVQEEHLATYAKKINKEDGCINWQNPASLIDQQIRAFNPWPIAYTFLDDKPLRIHEASVIELSEESTPGTIVSLDKKGMLVATTQGGLLIKKIQFPSAKAVSIADWLNSGKTQLHVGLMFP
ncbi:methionyl-tRNA formyltransferase [Legionella sp. km772]|uniref:methionyl-tRNA formyltransferase n=1 Tax=Legionella sp. km772 TaxID=2498111 RepID=UPI000F8CA629|nr:methionyl-tRNA formyltransferase [Legionella sp. km772]RUR13582.1 methionyl-tRNA formyltransferase [Legionella sp. km772]